MKLFDIFKKKDTTEELKSDLEKVKELGLITQEEVLILEIARAQKKLRDLGSDLKKRSHHRS